MAKDTEQYQRITPATSIKIPRKSDESCFSPLADRNMTDNRALCAKCGKKAIGAEFVSFDDKQASHSRMYAVVRFSCGCEGRKHFVISASNLFPQWDLVVQIEPGVWKISKVSIDKRIEMCSPDQM